MKIITINLPEKYLQAIQILNDMNIYPSRSEAIRMTILRMKVSKFLFAAKKIKLTNNPIFIPFLV
jgi:Arc/MetJ-type ribon-helix-helix transcriptional regulator